MDASQPEWTLGCESLRILDQRIRPDPFPQVALVPGVPVDRADHPERVPRGRKEDRDGAGLDQRALVERFVVIAVEEDQVSSPQNRVRNHLVGCARAVQHEVGSVGSEHFGSITLRLRSRALVNE